MATAFILDNAGASPLDLNDLSSYFGTGDIDVGQKDIQAAIYNGDLDPSQYDNALGAGRVTREIAWQLRLDKSGSTAGALLDLEQAINSKLTRASRASPIQLRLRPHGHTLDSFFDVIGGYAETAFDKRQETRRVKYLNLHLTCQPFAYGAAQAAIASASNALTPYAFSVTPTAGLEGDLPASVKIALTVNTTGSAQLASIMAAAWSESTNAALAGWLDSSSFTLGAIGSTVADAGARGGSVVKGTGTLTNSPQIVATVALPTQANGWPLGVPARILGVVRDKQTSAGNRGVTLIRASVGQVGFPSNGAIAHGDWVPIPPVALNGSTPLFCLADLGVFPMPVAPSSGSITPELRLYQQSSIASAAVDFDFVIIVPDSSFLQAEDPVGSFSPAVTMNFIDDSLFHGSGLGQAFPIVIGSHVRFKGPGRVFVGAYSQPAATKGSGGGAVPDFSPMNAAASVDYTPRYLGLA